MHSFGSVDFMVFYTLKSTHVFFFDTSPISLQVVGTRMQPEGRRQSWRSVITTSELPRRLKK